MTTSPVAPLEPVCSDKAPSLVGRRSESEALDRLLVGVHTKGSQVLVIRGEAGVGKTALLDYLVSRASGCGVARAAGVESEMELAYAGLHQLCAPMLDHLDDLPEPQRKALSTALGQSSGAPPDRFLVGLAALSLLAGYAAERPLICVVDDAQWLDGISAQALSFIARRLLAEPVALVFAVRESSDGHTLAGLADMEVRGLADEDARALLDSVIPGRLDGNIRDRIVAETRGNPLALLELPRGLSAAELAGGFGRPDARPLASTIEHSFLRRLQCLPADTQQLLLTAAAEPVGDVGLLRRAAERLGINAFAATSAEAAGLIDFGARVRFRHPLVRSAAYRAATPAARRTTHRALAEATDPDTDPDRRAWHAAHAAAEPDESVASELERSASRAQARGGVAAGAAFLQRATELTPDPAQRVVRALAAAEVKIEAGAPDDAYDLLATAEAGPLDTLQRARLARLRAQIVFVRNRGTEACSMFFEAAKQLEATGSGLARETYLESLGTSLFAGRLGSAEVTSEVARAALAAPTGPLPQRPTDLLLNGMATRCSQGYVAAVPLLRRALDAFRRDALRSDAEVTRWLWLAWPAAADLWDYQASHELATRAVRMARDAGALTVLPIALVYRAAVHVFAGEFDDAARLIEEADAIIATTGYAPVKTTQLVLAAMRGDEEDTTRLIEAVVEAAMDRGEGRALGLSAYATAVLNNGLGRYATALTAAQRACEHDDPGFFGWSLAELVEAGVRSGAQDAARGALRQLTERTTAAGTEWALACQARAQALVNDDEHVEERFREAITRFERTPILVHTGRTHLLFGEWLRRNHRKGDARTHLRVAEEMLTRIGAGAFADRARNELAASGGTVRRGAALASNQLSAQETQIARLAVQGLTNPEIGVRLFLSPHTVEWHLRKVFTKLDVRSRTQLHSKVATTG